MQYRLDKYGNKISVLGYGCMRFTQKAVLRKDATSASNCVECGLCEKHCPQKIEIRKELKNARKELEGPIYKIAKKVVPVVMKY